MDVCLSLQNRVVRQNPGERNYHIFYALLAGTNNQQRGETHVKELSGHCLLAPVLMESWFQEAEDIKEEQKNGSMKLIWCDPSLKIPN